MGGSRCGWVLQIKCLAIKPGNPGTDLEEKAAAKILKYRELYRDRRKQTSLGSLTAALLSAALSKARQNS